MPKIINNYLLLYMSSFFLIGITFTNFGSLIPFLAQDLHIEQTQYSLIFVLISIGCLAAAVLYKALESSRFMPQYHTICIVCLLGMTLFSFAMAFARTKLTQCLIFALLNMFAEVLVITVNVCLLRAPPKQDIGLWMSFSHGVFGVGALTAPLLVGIFQQEIFVYLAIACLMLTPAFHILKSPQINPLLPPQQMQLLPTPTQKKYISKTLQILLTVGFFIYIGIEVTIGSWVPSYAVLTGIKSKKQAVQFTSLFWILNTIFRFAFGLVRSSDVAKFTIMNWGQMLSGGICVLFIIGSYPLTATYLCCILYGISLAPLFPLLISLSSEFNLHITGGQLSNMMIATTISSGVFSSLTGVMMRWHVNMFFYSVMGFSIIFFFCAERIVGRLREESQFGRDEKGIELSFMAK